MRNVRNIALILLSVILISSCGGGGSDSAKIKGITEVHITFGARTAVSTLQAAAVPPEVRFILLRVSAPDLPVKEHLFDIAGRDYLQVTIEVPNGKLRHFEVLALDIEKAVKYQGDAFADLAGKPVTLTITMVPAGDAPPVFGGLQYIEILSSTSVMLGWDPAQDDLTPPDGMRYLVFAADTPGGEDFQNPLAVLTGVTNYTLEGLSPGQTYYFIVRALDEGGKQDGNTVEMDVTLPQAGDTTPPSFGGLQSAVADSWDMVTLAWNPATDDQTPQSGILYRIYQAMSPGGEDFTAPTYVSPAGATTYTVTGLSGGTTYYFIVRAVDVEGNEDGNTVELSVTTPLAALYVDVNKGNDITGDGSQTNPFRTLTKAMSAVQPGWTVYAEAGSYNANSGETFPIQIPQGVSLICNGPSYSTVLEGGTGITLRGGPGSSVYGCKITGDRAVTDGGNVMTVSNCWIDGASTFYTTGVEITADSTVTGSTITGFYSENVWVRSGNPVITNNRIENSGFDGIKIDSGNPLVNGNTFLNNVDNGVKVSGGSPSINGNTFDSNNNGVNVSGGSPGIANNTFNDNYFSGINVSGGIPVISGNTITGLNTISSAAGIRIFPGAGSGGLITGNTIDNQYTGIDIQDAITVQNNNINSNLNGISIGISITGVTALINSGNRIYNNTRGIQVTSGDPLIQGNAIYCNTMYDFGDERTAATPVDVSGNTWDHDTGTIPSGPTTDPTGQCKTLTTGVDICYDTTVTVPPAYTPFNPAVTGGCL